MPRHVAENLPPAAMQETGRLKRSSHSIRESHLKTTGCMMAVNHASQVSSSRRLIGFPLLAFLAWTFTVRGRFDSTSCGGGLTYRPSERVRLHHVGKRRQVSLRIMHSAYSEPDDIKDRRNRGG